MARPLVGSVMRESSFSSVDLPAPLRPTTPMICPAFTENETSFSAQKELGTGPRRSSAMGLFFAVFGTVPARNKQQTG